MRRTFLFWNSVNHTTSYKVMNSAKAIIFNKPPLDKLDHMMLKTHEDRASFFYKNERNDNQNIAASKSEGKKAFDDDIACSQ